MSEQSSIPDSHDPSDESNTPELTINGSALMHEKYAHDVAKFRRIALGKLASATVLDGTSAWAVFEPAGLRPDEIDSGVVAKDTLLCMTKQYTISKGYRAKIPIIRLVTNEIFRVEDRRECLTHDFILDHEDDTQYLVDVIDVEKMAAGIIESASPIFTVSQHNQLLIANWNGFPPTLPVNPGTEEKIYPYGKYTCLEDKVHALSVGQSILEGLVPLEPSAQS